MVQRNEVAYNKFMGIKERRIIKTNQAIRSAVCQILSSENPDHFTFKAIAGKANISEQTIRRRAGTPWKLLDIYNGEVVEEFKYRRVIQTEELHVGDLPADFFMLLQ